MQAPSPVETEHYALLPTNEVDREKEFNVDAGEDHSVTSPRWIRLCAYTSIALVILSYLVPAFSSTTTNANPSFASRAARLAHAASLPRPPMYIGLSRLNLTTALTALPDELVYFPHIFAPVSRSEPDKVWPTDGRARRTFNGVVSPGEPYVVLDHSSGTSMILQMRVQDYGMGRCAIAAIFPPPSDSQLKEQNRTLVLGSQRTRLDVWQLETRGKMEIDLTTLSWQTRPARSSLIGTVVAEAGKEARTSTFDCGESASLRTYEIACAEPIEDDEECKIEFWQEQPEVVPRMAFVSVQTPSL